MVRPTTFLELATETQQRWPKKGDRLIRQAADWREGADFSGDSRSRHVHIWSGYIRAGAALVEECERSSIDRHFLVYPILFTYRHGLELAIKWIIETYGRYASVHIGESELSHDLWSQWKLCKRVILEVGSDDTDGSVRVVEQIVKDFHDCDRDSVAFRYSTNRSGTAIELPKFLIDLQNVRDVMEGVDNFFTGADGQLDANTSAADW